MVAAGRRLQLSYFDHPPIAWWLAWGAAHLAGSDSAIIVRLPFIALFALTAFLMYRLTAALFGARAGLWAAAALNLAPVFGVTTGSLGPAGRPADRGIARCRAVPRHSTAGRGPGGLGLVARRRDLRRSRAAVEIFGGLDHPRGDRLSAERTRWPPLAAPPASLRRRLHRHHRLPAGADLECPARLDLAVVPGRAGGRPFRPVRPGCDARRGGAVLPPLGLGAVDDLRLGRAAARAPRPPALAARLPRGAADRVLYRDLAVEPRSLPLGGTGLSAAAAVARRDPGPLRAGRPTASGGGSPPAPPSSFSAWSWSRAMSAPTGCRP